MMIHGPARPKKSFRFGALVTLMVLIVSVITLVPAAPAQAQTTQTVQPTEHYRLMRSPGIGMQDYVGRVTASELANCSYDNTVNAVGLKGGSLYVRMLWHDLEPVEGEYAWPMLDRLFECVAERDQTLDLRVMTSYPANGQFDCWDDPSEDDSLDHGIPCWLVRKGVSELVHDGVGDTEATYLPDWDDATIREDHRQLINALGDRYDSNPRLNSVDVGSVGFWGEWHTYPNSAVMPSRARRTAILDLYASAFPTTPLVILAEVFKDHNGGDTQVLDHLRENYAGRYGWRGDSWGQLGHHVYDYTPIAAANPDLWETGPVAMEVTGIMDWWAARMGGDDYGAVLPLDTSVRDALTYHSSIAHNKAANIPTEYVNDGDPSQRDLRDLARRMGARLVPTELTFRNQLTAGENTQVTSTWHNRGAAPLYHDYRIWYRLSSASGTAATIKTGTSLKAMLPTGASPQTKTSTFRVPASVADGQYRLEVAVAHRDDLSLKMPLAIENPESDNWYDLGAVSVGEGPTDPGESQLTGITASAAANPGAAANIVDGDLDTSWDNGGNPADAIFTLDLGQSAEVTRIRYKDDFNRNLRITLDGTVLLNGWTSGAGVDTFAEIVVSPAVAGRQLRFELLESGNWLVPQEVEVFGTPAVGSDFACESNGGLLSWSDLGSNKYKVFRAGNGVETFTWIGRTVGSPASTTFTDQEAAVGYRYQVRDESGNPRANCVIISEPPAFSCTSNGGVLDWTDTGASKYRVYRSVDGQPLKWLGRTIGSPAPTTFTDANTAVGNVYAVQYRFQGPRVECDDATVSPTGSVLLDMHNDFLLGQNHVWSPLNGNQGSLDPADKLIQTFEFTAAVPWGATSGSFAAISASTELDVGELITYVGPGGKRLVTRVESISGSTATFSPPIQRALSSGARFWSVYSDAAHPNTLGYRALADFAMDQLSPQRIEAMRGTNHLFLGDSWMESDIPGKARLGQRIDAWFDGTITSTNNAVGGRTSGDVLNALSVDFPAGEDIQYVWLIVGTNDYSQQVPTSEFVDNVDQIVDYIESQGAVAIILNASVGWLDSTRTPSDQLLTLSQQYAAAQQAWFDAR